MNIIIAGSREFDDYEYLKEAMDEINRGLWAMGGCIVDFDSPNWYCKRDEFDF